MSGVKARRMQPLCEGGPLQSMTQPGDFHFETLDYDDCAPQDIPLGGEGRIVYSCPNGRGHCGGINIGNGHKPGNGRPSWQWDGNADAPTLTPSINCVGGCGWHGYLTGGVFRSC